MGAFGEAFEGFEGFGAAEDDGGGDGFGLGLLFGAAVAFAGGWGAGAAVGGSFRKGMEIKGMPGTGAGGLDRINGIHWVSRSRRGELAGWHGGHFMEALAGPADVAVDDDGFLDRFGLGGEFPGGGDICGETIAMLFNVLRRVRFGEKVAPVSLGVDEAPGGVVDIDEVLGVGGGGHGEIRLGGFGRGG